MHSSQALNRETMSNNKLCCRVPQFVDGLPHKQSANTFQYIGIQGLPGISWSAQYWKVFCIFQFRTKTVVLGSWPITDITSNFKDISLTKGIRLSMSVEVWSSLYQPRRINGNDIAHVLPISWDKWMKNNPLRINSALQQTVVRISIFISNYEVHFPK